MEGQTETTTATTTATPDNATTASTTTNTGDDGFLSGTTDTTEPTKTETTPQNQTDPNAKPQLIAGKYKTQDDLIKAHKELESKLGKLSATPETYEISDDLAAQVGVAWASDEQKAETITALKAAGLRQEQFEHLLPIYAQRVNEEISRRIHVVDHAAETDTLKQEWGSNFDSNLKEIGEFAKTLPPELIRAPLHHSAAGMKLLHQMMQEKRGPELINNNDSGSASVVSLNARLEEIVGDPNYGTNSAQGEKLQREAYEISKRISSGRR
jgi:hypothetical protein